MQNKVSRKQLILRNHLASKQSKKFRSGPELMQKAKPKMRNIISNKEPKMQGKVLKKPLVIKVQLCNKPNKT